MLAISLALMSSVVWGTSDFLGGVYTRRLSLAGVVVVSQAAAFAILIALFAITRPELTSASVGLGLAAGVAGSIGIATFYAALATGKMSIVSPVVACGALVPVVLALAGGERPGAAALAGAALALAGAVLASTHEYGGSAGSRRSVGLAVAAAVSIGSFQFLIGHAAHGGHVLTALVAARVASLSFLILGSVAGGRSMRVPRSALMVVALIGVLDTSANGLFAAATEHGYLSIVAVLGSVYPIVTVLLAQVVLSERITRVQAVGVAAALAGIGIVSAA